jgi:hypothetical protein
MRRIHCPLWALCLALCVIALCAFALGLFLRVGVGLGVTSDATQSKALATQAMATAFDLLKEPKPTSQVQRFTVPRAFSSAGETVGFTMQPLEAATYLVRSDDQEILLLLQQQPDGTARQCLIHPPSIHLGSCQLGGSTAKK